LILSLSWGTNADFPRHSRSVSIKFIWMLISSISISHNCLFFPQANSCPIRINVGKLKDLDLKVTQSRNKSIATTKPNPFQVNGPSNN